MKKFLSFLVMKEKQMLERIQKNRFLFEKLVKRDFKKTSEPFSNR